MSPQGVLALAQRAVYDEDLIDQLYFDAVSSDLINNYETDYLSDAMSIEAVTLYLQGRHSIQPIDDEILYLVEGESLYWVEIVTGEQVVIRIVDGVPVAQWRQCKLRGNNDEQAIN